MSEQQHLQRLLSQRAQYELEELLSRLNRGSQTRLSILDRPFVVTVIGGLFLALVANHWQVVKQRHSLQLELMRKLPSVFEERGNLLDSWLSHVEWVAEEKNQPIPDMRKIKAWSAEIPQIQDDYNKSNPIDDVVVPIEVAFDSREVEVAAEKLRSDWGQFEELMMKTNRDYNANESLSQSELKSEKESRRRIVDQLNVDESKLTEALAPSFAK